MNNTKHKLNCISEIIYAVIIILFCILIQVSLILYRQNTIFEIICIEVLILLFLYRAISLIKSAILNYKSTNIDNDVIINNIINTLDTNHSHSSTSKIAILDNSTAILLNRGKNVNDRGILYKYNDYNEIL